jgi:hypothetical protein
LLEVNIGGGTKLGQVVLLSAQLLTEATLGLDFLINYEAEISFPERIITVRVNEELFGFEFTGAKKHRLIVSVTWDLCPFIPKLNTRQQLLVKVIATQRIEGYTRRRVISGSENWYVYGRQRVLAR